MDDQSQTGATQSQPIVTPQDQVAYLQKLLDQTHDELAVYKKGMVDEIRLPVLTELIHLALAVEDFLVREAATATPAAVLDFLNLAVLGEVREALARYGVQAFSVPAEEGFDRRRQMAARIEEPTVPALEGKVHPLRSGYAMGDKILEKELVVEYRRLEG